MSGSAYGNWPVPQNQLGLAKKQAKLVGCPDDTPANIIKCLKTKPAKELGDSLPNFKVSSSMKRSRNILTSFFLSGIWKRSNNNMVSGYRTRFRSTSILNGKPDRINKQGRICKSSCITWHHN